jgi:hypothetical protein
MRAYPNAMNYASVGMCFMLILLFVHIVTTICEHRDQTTSKSVSSDCDLKDKKLLGVPPTNKNTRRMVNLKKDIEEKFAKSLMSKTYSFPRRSD